jgi:trk system potassium uptake protein TrkA
LRFNIPNIWAKAVTDAHGQIFDQLGVQHVIYPEKDMGRRVAHLVRGAALDYIEVDHDFAIVKMSPNSLVRDISLGDTSIRAKYGVTVLAFKRGDGGWTNTGLDTVLRDGDVMLVAGPIARAEAFGQLQ